MVKQNNTQFLQVLEERAAEYRTKGDDVDRWWYKLIAEGLGTEPWRIILPLALLMGMGMVFLLRGWAVKGVSILQWGF